MNGRIWVLTIPHANFVPYLPPTCRAIKGQLELGQGGFLHWQVIVWFSGNNRLTSVKKIFGSTAHCELSRSEAANEYVWKEDTRVEGTQFKV